RSRTWPSRRRLAAAGPRHQLLRGAEPGPRCGKGEPGAVLARLDGVHATGTRRAGVCRGYDQHAANRHRPALRAVARPTWPGGAGRAHRVHRFCQPVDQEQHGARDQVAGLLRCLRGSAHRASGEVRLSVDGVTEDPFVAHRGLLFTVAYEMLGSAADADDVLQEAWLRWANVDHSHVI